MDICEGISTSDENDCNLDGLIHDYHDNKNEVIEVSPKGRFYKFNDIINQSAFKTVHRALDSESGCEVAWTTISLKNLTEDEITQISKEAKLNHQLQHKNIICMNSAWTNRHKEELIIISEIITGGSLKNYLSKLPTLRLKLIKTWCRGILLGLDYLHSQKVPIIHGELTSDTIFIMSSDGSVKISDFYLNKLVRTSSTVMGRPEYIAPEVFQVNYSTKADIYSFGMTLLEMCIKKSPYSECSTPSEVYHCIKTGVLPKALEMINEPEMVSMIKLCLSSQLTRPSAKELLTHKFLEINECPKNLMPVSFLPKLRIDTQKASSIKHVCLIINDSHKSHKEISFDFDVCCDTPEKVASELVESLKMNKSSIINVAKEIESKLQEGCQSGMEDYRCKIDEPNTAAITYEEVNRKLKRNYSLGDKYDVLENKEMVKQAQVLLSKLFAVKLNSDGFIGKKTIMFIKKFQHQEGLSTNGLINDELFKLLTHRINQQ